MKKKVPEVKILYFFKKIKNKVYRFVSFNGGASWIKEDTVLKHEPFVYWSPKHKL